MTDQLTAPAVVPADWTYAQSRLTCGTHVFGVRELFMAYGGEGFFPFPPIPCSRAEIDRAAELGHYLIYQPTQDRRRTPLTMREMYNRFGNLLKGDLLFSNAQRFEGEAFFTKQTMREGWFWVSQGLIPGSTHSDFVYQTEDICNYLRDRVYVGQDLPEVYAQAIAEFVSRKYEILELMEKDWKRGARECARLQINRLCRERPVEAMHGNIVYRSVNARYPMLGEFYAGTNARCSDGSLVYVGHSTARGTGVIPCDPNRSESHLGVRFSSSAAVPVPGS
jgi:hypothetical protein